MKSLIRPGCLDGGPDFTILPEGYGSGAELVEANRRKNANGTDMQETKRADEGQLFLYALTKAGMADMAGGDIGRTGKKPGAVWLTEMVDGQWVERPMQVREAYLLMSGDDWRAVLGFVALDEEAVCRNWRNRWQYWRRFRGFCNVVGKYAVLGRAEG